MSEYCRLTKFNYGSSLNIFFLNSGLKTRLMSQVADFISLPKGSIVYSYSVWYSSKLPERKRTNKEFKWIASKPVLRQSLEFNRVDRRLWVMSCYPSVTVSTHQGTSAQIVPISSHLIALDNSCGLWAGLQNSPKVGGGVGKSLLKK